MNLGATADYSPWSASEERLLRKAYADGGAALALSQMPHRTKASIYHRVRRLRICRNKWWSPAEDDRLRKLWDAEMQMHDIAERLGRTQEAVYVRASLIGLPPSKPDGWEYLSHAAERTGFHTSQLRRILDAAGISPRPVLTRPVKGEERRRRRHIVWPADVDAAVGMWHESEPLKTAAQRHGLSENGLKSLLRRIGIKRPALPRKRHWRVRHEDVERALEQRTNKPKEQ
jgi:hypothetical protein